MAIDTGGPSSPRRVLLTPRFLSGARVATRVFHTELSREELENGLCCQMDLPVAARQEAGYYVHYRAGPYRGGWFGMVPGIGGATYASAFQVEPPARGPAKPEERAGDPHLRSVREAEGYRIRSADGEIGHLEDLVVDDERWMIRYVVVDASNWLTGKKVLVSPRWISGVGWADAEVHADVGSIEIKGAPAWVPGTPIDREYEIRLHSCFGCLPYWVYDR